MSAQTTASIQPDVKAVVDRLPEITLLDGPIRREVEAVFSQTVPQYFWIARASEEHHPPDERGLTGLWLHTKRVFTAYMMLEPTYRAMGLLGPYQAKCCRAAVLLHDGFKYGQDPSDTGENYHEYADSELAHLPQYTDRDHDITMADYVAEHTALPLEVVSAIRSHGGSPDWYSHNGPKPEQPHEMIVHLADVLASNSEHKLPVLDPHSSLLQVHPDLPTLSEGWDDD